MNELGGLFLLAKVGPMPALPAENKIQDLIYEARVPGLPGNQITVAYTTGGTAGTEVVTVTLNAISVQIDDGVSTAEQIKKAVDAFPAANALVKVNYHTTKEVPQAIQAATNLAFGYDPSTFPQMFAGLRTKKLTLGAEEIDVTNHSSDNYKTLLDKCGTRSFSMDAGGVCQKDEVWARISIICEKNLLQEFLLVDVVNQITRSGKFKISSLENSADYNGAQNFSCKLSSSGRLSKSISTAQEMDETI